MSVLYLPEIDFKRQELRETELKFKRACLQIVLLNKYVERLKFRYLKAKDNNFRCFRYSLRLRLSVLEGVRNMFYDFAHEKAQRVAEIRHDLFGQLVEIVESETDYEDSSDDDHNLDNSDDDDGDDDDNDSDDDNDQVNLDGETVIGGSEHMDTQ